MGSVNNRLNRVNWQTQQATRRSEVKNGEQRAGTTEINSMRNTIVIFGMLLNAAKYAIRVRTLIRIT